MATRAERLAELEGTIEVVKAEASLEKAKGTKAGPTPEQKEELREKRLRVRAERDGLVVVKDKRGRVRAVEPAEAKGLKRA